MKLEALDAIERRLSQLIEAPFRELFREGRADQLLARRLVEAMSSDLSVDAGGRVVAPVYYEIKLNPQHASLWAEDPNLTRLLNESLLKAAIEQGIAFERPPVINAAYDTLIPIEEIRVVTLEFGDLPGTTAVNKVGDIESSTIPGDAFLIINGDRHMVLDKPVITIGRANNNQLVLDSPQVSRVHAQLRAIDGVYHIFDLDSTCGTRVNGEIIYQAALRSGDVIDIGGITMIYGQESVSSDKTTNMAPVKPDKGTSK
ncbi:MAG: DUF3662 domain-containing protein [Anaerolineaceae bacterium]|nr:DUF3662 domain-containing protein [Anaerolineaceae bacterium]